MELELDFNLVSEATLNVLCIEIEKIDEAYGNKIYEEKIMDTPFNATIDDFEEPEYQEKIKEKLKLLSKVNEAICKDYDDKNDDFETVKMEYGEEVAKLWYNIPTRDNDLNPLYHFYDINLVYYDRWGNKYVHYLRQHYLDQGHLQNCRHN